MSFNPYEAPATRIGDVPAVAIGRPPHLVMVAAFLITLVALIDVRDVLRDIRRFDAASLLSQINLAVDVLDIALLVTIAALVIRRRSWARWVFLAMVASRLLFFYTSVHATFDPPAGVRIVVDTSELVIGSIPPISLASALVLLLWPARAWFKGSP